MSFLRYPAYKDSDAEWIGATPTHWRILAAKRVFDIVGGSAPASDTAAYWYGDVPWVTPADLSKLLALEISESQRSITDAGGLSGILCARHIMYTILESICHAKRSHRQ